MGRRIDSMLFPGGKAKALTLSYDDGVVQDRRLVALCSRWGVKCTFNLGYGVLGYQGSTVGPKGKPLDVSKIPAQEVPSLYAGQDIGGHGLYHSALDRVGTPLATYEIIEDRRCLEALTGRLVRMFAYPYGTFNRDVKQILGLSGYQGARTVRSTHAFSIPEDFLEWDPTCHHNDPELMHLAEQFCTGNSSGPALFFLWGHTYEFDGNENWDVMEKFLEYVSAYRQMVWFASNTEILDYVTAYRRLIYSADGSMICNPSGMDVWITLHQKPFRLPGGSCTSIPEAAL